jgi:hypothetical protein
MGMTPRDGLAKVNGTDIVGARINVIQRKRRVGSRLTLLFFLFLGGFLLLWGFLALLAFKAAASPAAFPRFSQAHALTESRRERWNERNAFKAKKSFSLYDFIERAFFLAILGARNRNFSSRRMKS